MATLALADFRNFTRADIELTPGLTAVVGANGQGKTNLLEALMIASRLRSPRTDQLRDTVRWDTDLAAIHVGFADDRRPRRVDITIGARGLAVKVDGQSPTRRADAVGTLLAVLFTPDDLRLIKDEPEKRRAFLDGLLALTQPQIAGLPSEYTRVVRQRNALLKRLRDGTARGGQTEAWDEQLVRHGAALAVGRAGVCDSLARAAAENHERLAPGQNLQAHYISDVLAEGREPVTVADRFARRLTERRGEETARGITLVGPHRDDLSIQLNGHGAREFGSQGQQRTVVLALKLAELEVVKAARGSTPVLLLDDVMSELDRDRRAALAKCVAELEQTIITTATPEYFAGSLVEPARWLRLTDGVLIAGSP